MKIQIMERLSVISTENKLFRITPNYSELFQNNFKISKIKNLQIDLVIGNN